MSSVESTFLQSINRLIEERLRPLVVGDTDAAFFPEADLTMACRHLCISDHGKRARPLLVLYFHSMLSEKIHQDLVPVSVAAEFIHAASLLHDDIIDDAERRRGKSAANRMFGNAKAVLAGDFLLTEAFDLLRPFDRAMIDQAILVIREMTKAAILEFNLRGRLDVSIDNLREIYRGKTGALFAWCGFAAGIIARDQLAANLFFKAGERIGIIFQLADDIKDFDGDKNLKDICRDIRNRELSLPIRLATDEGFLRKKFEQAFLLNEIDEKTAIELKDRVIESGAHEKAKAIMAEEVEQVREILAPFSGTMGKALLERFVLSLAS